MTHLSGESLRPCPKVYRTVIMWLPQSPQNVGRILIFPVFTATLKFLTWQTLNWVFVVNTMNFSFWPETDDKQCEVTYKGTTYTGYMTLCAAISRAMDEGTAMFTIK